MIIIIIIGFIHHFMRDVLTVIYILIMYLQ